MQIPARPLPIVLLALLLAACRAEEAPPRPAAAEPRPAAASGQETPGTAAAGAVLTVTGQPAFQGTSSFFCVPHAVGGLQVDFRTGDADLPTVAVRIESYAGSGPYQARLFVTGRSLSGGLVTSAGEADVDVRQRTPASGAVALIDGTFHGRYDGEAGKGAIEGRFGSCTYSSVSGFPSSGGSPSLAGGSTAAATDGKDGQPAGAAEETP
ncbi:MAG: hypothetical protein ABIS20_11935 [Thermoanaerobaculia bacterium]